MSEDSPPDRPRRVKPVELGFTPRRPVQWLSPRELASTGVQVVVSGLFGAYADKREIQGVMNAAEPGDLSQAGELWIDYVSDLGDGFDATYTVARLLAEPSLAIGPDNRRGHVLVMGGDQVYPSATVAAYQDRSLGPYKAAFPHSADEPLLYALPGNHDWYDGLTAFLRVFCQGRWIGGWRTCQTRSYWAMRLPSRWWLWGIDIQFDTYIDEPQLRFFRTVAQAEGSAGLEPGDGVILCSAKPSWVKSNEEEPESYATLDFFEREIIRPEGARVRLSLTGDTHHYARYEGADGSQKITAGGGGAYLSATHHLPPKLVLPPPTSHDPGKTTPPATYVLRACYPDARTSKWLRFCGVRLLWRNWSFLLVAAAVHLLLCFGIASEARGPGDTFGEVMRGLTLREVLEAIPRSGGALFLMLLLVGGLLGFTKAKRRKLVRWPLGLVHAVGHVVLFGYVMEAAARIAREWHGVGFDVAFVGFVAVAGGIGSGLVMALYLTLADFLTTNDNELYAAQGIVDYKSFLRLHVAGDGTLTVYPIKVERVGRGRQLYRSESPTDPWIDHKKPPSAPALIEEPTPITREASS